MENINREEILKVMKEFIEDNDSMFGSVWINYLYDFVSELTGIDQSELEKYVNENIV